MEQFELHLDPLDVQSIAEDALRQDHIEQLERDNEMLAHERDIAVDQRNWAWLLNIVLGGAIVARYVWAAVRG